VALARAGFSPGEIDGVAGANTSRALTAFQASHGLEASGVADAATRKKLREVMPGSALRVYTITAEDADGPFTPDIPEDTMEKASLPALGYGSIVELLAERFHVDPDLLRRLNPRSDFSAGRRIRVPDLGADPTPAPAATVRVSKGRSVAEAFDADGRLVFFAPISAGSDQDPLPLGEWKVTAIVENPTFSYDPDLFWDADESHAKAKLAAGPNNPVGLVWIDLDKEHYGLHGTDEPSMVGHRQSHGCVRLTNWDARRLASLLRVGTPVVFVE
jgi:lipoprotein-anchoring transpeptidase ErfK/SrfK